MGKRLVQLADHKSIFPQWYDEELSKRGFETILLTSSGDFAKNKSKAKYSYDYESIVDRLLRKFVVGPFAYVCQRIAPLYREKFFRLSGIPPLHWQDYFSYFEQYWKDALGQRSALRALRPDCVIAHEVSRHGLGAVLFKNVPVVLIPWGGDVFIYSKSSPFMYHTVKYCLQHADLVLPSSIYGGEYIHKTFSVPREKIKAISPGINLAAFAPPSIDAKRRVREQWNIPLDSIVVVSPRRFRPPWGALEIMEAFVSLAQSNSSIHFIVIGGDGTEKYTDTAKAMIETRNLNAQFTILSGVVPYETYKESLFAGDLFISVSPVSDMRSATVLQAACTGLIPVMLENPEWNLLAGLGFRAYFFQERTPSSMKQALTSCLNKKSEWEIVRANNSRYLEEYENGERQWDIIAGCIRDNIVSKESVKS